MAKRKSTDKTSKSKTEEQVEADTATTPLQSSDDPKSDLETAADAVDVVDKYAPNDGATDEIAADLATEGDPDENTTIDPVSDDVIEQQEPEDVISSPSGSDTKTYETTEAPDGNDEASVDDHLSEDEAEELIVDAETVEGHHADPDPVTPSENVPVAPQIVRETTVEHKAGFVPMVLGGVVAAALGYGVAAYVSQDVWPFATAEDTSFEDDLRDALTTQDGALSDLGARLAALEQEEAPTVDLTPIEDQLATVQTATSDLTAQLEEITARIDTLERQPLEQAVSPEAIAAYERALADLQAEVETQRAEVVQMAQEAVAAEENAEGKAQLAASRAALAEITTALDSGDAFQDAVGILSSNGIDVPDALTANAESGVQTKAGLMTDFPDAARSALSAARSVDTETAEGSGRIATFFANQLGARSVAPRDGNDPDAVLSRAEAAVRSGDLETALSEIAALPEVAQTALSDWQSRAQTRLEAQTAADSLVQQLLQE